MQKSCIEGTFPLVSFDVKGERIKRMENKPIVLRKNVVY